MGDRFDRQRPRSAAERRLHLRGKPPPTILAWGLGVPASMGHNNGPPLDEEPGYLFRRYRWKKVHAEVWKTPSMGVLKFRVARAEAAGLSYREYMLTLLDTGRFAQARDQDEARNAALARLRSVWTETLHVLAPDAPRMNAAIILASITSAYDEPQRAYHNAVHVAAVLDHLDRFATAQNDGAALRMAALFHDVVYDATRHDNEVASARLARMHLTDLGVEEERVLRIARMIEATRHRLEDVVSADADTALLLDCDLAVLAASGDRYTAYASAVRQEYAHVPDEDFRCGRARVLDAFLARPQIYASAMLRGLWEAKARANLARERDALQSNASV